MVHIHIYHVAICSRLKIKHDEAMPWTVLLSRVMESIEAVELAIRQTSRNGPFFGVEYCQAQRRFTSQSIVGAIARMTSRHSHLA